LFKAAYYSHSSRVFAEYFFSDMSHRPSKANNENMHCHGLLKSQSKHTKPNNEKKHCHGLLKPQAKRPKKHRNKPSTPTIYPNFTAPTPSNHPPTPKIASICLCNNS
jgi:hypothetical protein